MSPPLKRYATRPGPISNRLTLPAHSQHCGCVGKNGQGSKCVDIYSSPQGGEMVNWWDTKEPFSDGEEQRSTKGSMSYFQHFNKPTQTIHYNHPITEETASQA